ncbi:MAG: hypothetical protein OHK0024_15490 [Thalassobaculales bacterium]
MLIRLLAVLAFLAAGAATAAEFTPAQEEAIGRLVREYLLRHPEVLREAFEELQVREQREVAERRQALLAAMKDDLERHPGDPVLGNPDGDVTVVEFFDYRCPYCKAAAPTVERLAHEDGRVRRVMKELPILGPESVIAARAALAARRQGKYALLHAGLIAAPGRLDEAAIFRIAGEKGLDLARLRRDMDAPEVVETLTRVRDEARALDISGTPAFVIGGVLVPGAIDHPTLKSLVAKARGG